MDLTVVFEKVALALGLGLLVGLQRERVQSPLAGIRTFALITVLGAVCALLGQNFGGWVVAVGVAAVAALLVMGNVAKLNDEAIEPGLTTEFAALLMYGVGAYLVIGHTAVGIAVGGGVALLLQWKAPMHAFVARVGEADLRAIMQFVLIALVIWPVLPDQGYGPYEVLNPHEIWLMVVLIVGISLGGYVAYKLFGGQAGAILGGVLGGLISSTATTVSYARHSRQTPEETRLAALVILIASAVALLRVLVEIAVVASAALPVLGPPLAALLGWMALLAAGLYALVHGKIAHTPGQENPAELKPALVFGGLYAVVILGVAVARDYVGDTGLYAVAAISGLHDLDAITLSTARLVDLGQMEAGTGWRMILSAVLSNLIAKGLLAAVMGGHRLLSWLALPFSAALAGGIGLLLLWPSS